MNVLFYMFYLVRPCVRICQVASLETLEVEATNPRDGRRLAIGGRAVQLQRSSSMRAAFLP